MDVLHTSTSSRPLDGLVKRASVPLLLGGPQVRDIALITTSCTRPTCTLSVGSLSASTTSAVLQRKVQKPGSAHQLLQQSCLQMDDLPQLLHVCLSWLRWQISSCGHAHRFQCKGCKQDDCGGHVGIVMGEKFAHVEDQLIRASDNKDRLSGTKVLRF